MSYPKILVQLDPDAQPSSFDAIVAVDAEVDHLLQYRQVEPAQVRQLVHGAIFTRGPQELKNTALFIGGHDVERGARLLDQVVQSFFGPLRVSVLMDSNGANTTAAAAVLAAARHVSLPGSMATVLAATGPVGQRVVQLLVQQGCRVRVGSRQPERAEAVCRQIQQRTQAQGDLLQPWSTASGDAVRASLRDIQIVVAAGAAGIQLLGQQSMMAGDALQVAIDLNAVPPLGIETVAVSDKAESRQGVLCYGAVGVGGTKMKIHRAAIRRLFERNDLVLDLDEVYQLGLELD